MVVASVSLHKRSVAGGVEMFTKNITDVYSRKGAKLAKEGECNDLILCNNKYIYLCELGVFAADHVSSC